MAEICVAVLAAGLGTRFGGDKLEAPCAGKPLGRWALDAATAAGLKPGLLITGPDGVTFGQGWMTLINPQPEIGLGSSLAELGVGFGKTPLHSPAFENRDRHLTDHVECGQKAVPRQTERSVIGPDLDRRQPFTDNGASRGFRRAHFLEGSEIIRTLLVGAFQRLVECHVR